MEKYHVKMLGTGCFLFKLYTLQAAVNMVRSNEINSEVLLISSSGKPSFLISSGKVFNLNEQISNQSIERMGKS